MINESEAKLVGYITIPPPSWKTVLNWLKRGVVKDIDELLPAIEIADIVMEAQQSGAKSITFTFDGNKIVGWETEK